MIGNATKEVSDFIDKFYNDAEKKGINGESLRSLFMDGHCMDFAAILQVHFNRGERVATAPFDHVVWEDIDGKCYDIEGEYISGDVEALVPLSDPLYHPDLTKEEAQFLIDKYKDNLGNFKLYYAENN
jgi:hypothetical protein